MPMEKIKKNETLLKCPDQAFAIYLIIRFNQFQYSKFKVK